MNINPFGNDSTIFLHLFWWNKWRNHVIQLKRWGGEGYSHAAVIAQAQYVMYNALYWAERNAPHE